MEPRDDQNLWDLLGRLPARQVSPFFARNVLRQIREVSAVSHFGRVRSWIQLRNLVRATALTATVIGLAIVFHYPIVQRPSEQAPDVVAKVDPQDFEVVADLDDLLASDEGSLWAEKPNL